MITSGVPYLFWMINSSKKIVNTGHLRFATIVNCYLVLILIYTRFPKNEKSSNHKRVWTTEMQEQLPNGSLLNLLWSLELFILWKHKGRHQQRKEAVRRYILRKYFQNFLKIQRKTLEVSFKQCCTVEPCNIVKKILWYRYFPV